MRRLHNPTMLNTFEEYPPAVAIEVLPEDGSERVELVFTDPAALVQALEGFQLANAMFEALSEYGYEEACNRFGVFHDQSDDIVLTTEMLEDLDNNDD